MHRIAVLLALLVIGWISPAGAQVALIDGQDPEDGTRIVGVRLTSEDGRAFLFAWCDADNTNPRLIFAHGGDLDQSTKPVGFDVTIDDATTYRHYFAVMQNTKAAVFFVRTAEMYHDRFGQSPHVFDETNRAVNPDYIAWTDNVYNQVIADLFFSRIAVFDFTDGSGAVHSYRFQLVRLAEHIGRLATCYEAPRVF